MGDLKEWAWLGLGDAALRGYRAILFGTPLHRAVLRTATGLDDVSVDEAIRRLTDAAFLTDGVAVPPGPALRAALHERLAEVHARQAELEAAEGRLDQLIAGLTATTGEFGVRGTELVRGAENVSLRVADLLASARERNSDWLKPRPVTVAAWHGGRPPAAQHP